MKSACANVKPFATASAKFGLVTSRSFTNENVDAPRSTEKLWIEFVSKAVVPWTENVKMVAACAVTPLSNRIPNASSTDCKRIDSPSRLKAQRGPTAECGLARQRPRDYARGTKVARGFLVVV